MKPEEILSFDFFSHFRLDKFIVVFSRWDTLIANELPLQKQVSWLIDWAIASNDEVWGSISIPIKDSKIKTQQTILATNQRSEPACVLAAQRANAAYVDRFNSTKPA